MRREVVQDFLNLPGIAGLALIDGRSRPYFYGIDQILNFQQKEALAQGIQQVVETTPSGFEFFEFQFTEHQVYIYKLEHGIILLVLTGNSLVTQTYSRAIELLKRELQDDIANAIATFRLLAGNITLSNQDYWKRRSATPSAKEPALKEAAFPAPSHDVDTQSGVKDKPNGAQSYPKTLDPEPVSSPIQTPVVQQSSPIPKSTQVVAAHPANLKDLIAALNHLSQFTTQYLGTTVITNYWKSTRPSAEWLSYFQVDRSAQFTFSGPESANPQVISPEEHQQVQEWVAAFIQRCSKVIRDFPLIIEQRALDDPQKTLLLPNKP
jgi:hypothetical protein